MNILVTVPNKGWIHKNVVFVLLRLQLDRRYQLRFIMPTHHPYENNQHRIVRDFLKGGEDYWLSIDADNPPTQNPLDLIELDKDIIGLPTPVWHFLGKDNERPIYWNAYRIHDDGSEGYNEWKPQEGLQRVDAIGTGCFIVARRVFENVAMQKGAFTRKLNGDGTVDKGNDISFSERALAQGFEIWAHFDYPCDHFSELSLNDVARSYCNLGLS